MSDHPAECGPDCGNGAILKTADGTLVPLKGVEISAEVFGGDAEVRLRQRFRNDEPKPVEAVYIFPMPAEAVLSGFSMTCRGRRLDGRVEEREAGFRRYHEAIQAGHGGALLEQERPDVFTVTAGNLLAGEETVIEITWLQRLQIEDGAVRFVIPTLVAPRYIPGVAAGDRTGHGRASPTDQVPDADRITPPVGIAGYGLKIDVAFHVGQEANVMSPSHALQISRDGRIVRATFAQPEVALDRDVVLLSETAAEEPLISVAAHRRTGSDGAFALTLVQDLFDPARTPHPMTAVFVLDISGSMAGTSIREARTALRLCLRQLQPGGRFTIVAFNDRHQAFAAEPVAFDAGSLAAADRWIDNLRPDGGTEMLPPLLAAAGMAGQGEVILLTDGQVGNGDEILKRVLAARRGARFSAIGIGTSVATGLLLPIARQTGGECHFVHPGERIDSKVAGLFARLAARRITGVTAEFRGLDVKDLAPSSMGDIVDGEPWTVRGRYRSGGEGTAVLRGRLDGEAFTAEIPVVLPETAERPVVEKLWAAACLRECEDREAEGQGSPELRRDMVALAVKHGLQSRLTSFVVVETREGDRLAPGIPAARVVPVSLPAGWAMFAEDRSMTGAMAMICGSPPPSMAAPGAGSFLSRLVRGFRSRDAGPAALRDSLASSFGAPASAGDRLARYAGRASNDDPPSDAALKRSGPGPSRSRGGDPVTALMERQGASGLWDDATLRGTGKPAREILATARAALTLHAAGITTSHPVYGAQLRKTVDALAALAKSLAAVDAPLGRLALQAAALLASGRRARAKLEALAAAACCTTAELEPGPALRAAMERSLDMRRRGV